ncbi:hypothetical protein ACEYW6_20165 [Nostoc sp. UIC 10607]
MTSGRSETIASGGCFAPSRSKIPVGVCLERVRERLAPPKAN